jgi:hypothetical protein
MRSIKLVLLAKRYPGEQIKKNEMDRACGTYARETERGGAQRLVVGKPEENRHLENLGVDGRIILVSIFKKSVGRT